MKTKKQIGRRIDKELKARGLTVRQAAFRAGVSPSGLQQVVNGEVDMRLGTAKKIAKLLKMSEADLIGAT